ncbi:MAG: MATE family efflux transporter [Firmicutes bacterium]|nr:MATE family efflux transporter [Bacillota bacterium]
MKRNSLSRSRMDLTEGPLAENIILYALPIIATGMLQLLFNAADLVVVGRFCGSVSVAAVGATGAVINLTVTLFIGLSVGVGVQVATSLGAKDYARVSDTVHTAIPLGLIGGVALTGLGAALTLPLLRLMSTPDDVIGLSALYMRIYFAGMPASLIYNYGAAAMRADGDTRRPLYYLSTAGVVNVIMNVIFVVFFGLDVAGVALATIASQYLSAGLVLLALKRETGPIRFEWKKMKIRKEPLLQIVRIGLPAGLQGAMFSISNTIIQSSLNSFGSVAMAGCAAASNIEGFCYVAMNAFNQCAMNFIGQNYGAGKYDRVRKVVKLCVLDVVAVGLIVGWTVYLSGRTLLGIYITDSEDAIGYGLTRMKFISTVHFLNGLHDTMTGVLRGLGSSFVPMAVTVFGVCVTRIIWIYTVFQIPAYHSLEMLFIVYPISWIITSAMLFVCYGILARKKLPVRGR